MIEVQHLSKFYGSFAAVRDLTFSIAKGEIVAFLGPNGAGKSTTMKMLTGFLAPTSGSVKVAGYDLATQRLEAARRIGYLPEEGPLYLDMTPKDLLIFFGEARGMGGTKLRERVEVVASQCAIRDVMEKPIGNLSKGYRQRVGMAQALLHDPDVLVMDEPTSGLDPNQTRQVREMLGHLGRDRAILLSTHILQEVSAVATRVLFIHHGRLVYDGIPDALAQSGESLDDAFARLTNGGSVHGGTPSPRAETVG